MENILKVPYGTRDFLPLEAREKRIIENKLAELFLKWGYKEVVTPAVEYLDTLTIGGRFDESRMYRFTAGEDKTLALRHEMTIPIARLAASRFKESALPLKLSYISSVYRGGETQKGRQCEFYQAGVELLGISNAFADAEIISLAAQALKCSGLDDFKICLGQVEFASGLMEQNNLSSEIKTEIKSAIERHDIVALENLPVNDSLKKIPKLQGGREILSAAEVLAKNERSLKALDNLTEIYRLLELYGVADKITFDLGLIRDFEYYTGMVFEAYAAGVGYSLAGGGRYDNMLKDFGAACPATGFALGIERILSARKFQGVAENFRAKDFYLSYAAGNEGAAIGKAAELRAANKIVEVSLTPQDKVTAEKSCTEKNCLELVYLA